MGKSASGAISANCLLVASAGSGKSSRLSSSPAIDAAVSGAAGGSGATGTTRFGFGRAFAGAACDAGVGGAGISVSVAERTTSSADFGGSTGHSDHAAWIRIDNASAIHSERRTWNGRLAAIRREGTEARFFVNVAIAKCGRQNVDRRTARNVSDERRMRA